MMEIKEITKKNKKEAEKFRSKEWSKFNQEGKYKWNPKNYILGAYDSKNILGVIEFNIIGGIAYLKDLIVGKVYRKKGVGLALLKKLEVISKNERCHAIYLDTSEKHKEALKFYKDNNFKIINKLKNYRFHFNWYILMKNLK
jgi:ribosomal protein S18 acetylase RimI-like enzyme